MQITRVRGFRGKNKTMSEISIKIKDVILALSCTFGFINLNVFSKTSQELRMLSSVTLNCQATKIVMNSGSQLSEL